MSVSENMREKLTAALKPKQLEIIDDSARHAGHAGAGQGGESHFNVKIVSDAFSGLSRLERQRLVYGLLGEELAGPVHALSLVTKSLDES